MTIASDLLQRHIQTLVADNAQWQTLIADDLVWELPYAPAIGHPARLAGREEVVGLVTWFLGAVEQFPLLRPHGVCLRRSGRGRRRSQGGGAYQADGAALSPGVCGVPAGGRRQDRVPPRIFRSRACSQGDGHANSWSRILRGHAATGRLPVLQHYALECCAGRGWGNNSHPPAIVIASACLVLPHLLYELAS